MTSRRFPAPLRVDLQPSRILAIWLVCLHLLCATVVIVMLPLLPALLGILVLLCTGVWHYRQWRQPLSRLRYYEGRWFLGAQERPVLFKNAWVTPSMAALFFCASPPANSRIFSVASHHTLLVYRDSCGAEEFRRLKVLLRFARVSDQY